MKKLFFLLIVLCSTVASARDKHFAIEFGGGINTGIANLDAAACLPTNNNGFDFYAEMRYRIKQSPFEVGLHVAENLVLRTSITGLSKFDFWSTNYMVVGNYNKRFSKLFSGFAGLGVGICKYEDDARIKGDLNSLGGLCWVGGGGSDGNPSLVALMPRIGVQFWKLRLTMGYKIQEKANRHFFTTLGLSFNF